MQALDFWLTGEPVNSEFIGLFLDIIMYPIDSYLIFGFFRGDYIGISKTTPEQIDIFKALDVPTP